MPRAARRVVLCITVVLVATLTACSRPPVAADPRQARLTAKGFTTDTGWSIATECFMSGAHPAE